jgi:hypothetical protein
MNVIYRLALAAAVVAATSADGQQQGAAQARASTADIVVKTVTLRHLSSNDATQLLAPYVQTPGGGVFPVPGVRAVTIREVPRVFTEMQKILATYDRSPATVTLNFQLIAAEEVGPRDPAIAGLDSLLRGVLKYSGYRLLRTTVANATEHSGVSQSLAADQEMLTLKAFVEEIRTDGSDGSVRLTVSLDRDAVPATPTKPGVMGKELLSTGVSVPIGHTVVLGAAAADGGNRAFILTVRPQLVNEKREH